MYKYEGIELSPSVFADLLITLFAGKQFKRKDAISEVVKYHSSNGGMLNKNEYVSVFKKAVQRLKEYGIQNRGYGIWLLPSEDNTPITIIDSNDDKADAGICSIEKTIGKTRCVSNQLGYVIANEHLTFKQESIIVI